METTLLYILHWILLDSAEECSENYVDPSNPFFYLFPIPTMTVNYLNFSVLYNLNINCENDYSLPSIQLFVYLFAPLFNHLKDIDFKTNLRLENGLKIWSAMYECRHPEASCFTAHCRVKSRIYWSQSFKSAKHHMLPDDVFVGGSKFTLKVIHKTCCIYFCSIMYSLIVYLYNIILNYLLYI